MSIDPRYMEEILKLRLLDQSGILSGSASSTAPAGVNEFTNLLESLLQPLEREATSTAALLTSMTAPERNEWNGLLYRNYRSIQLTDYEQIIADASDRYGVDASLIQAVIQTESGYKADAVSKAGAKGLMQLMDDTAEGLGVRDAFDPEQNIMGGTKFLGYLVRKYNGNEALALAAYNAGPGRVDRLGIDSQETLLAKYDELPQETQAYIQKVLKIRHALL